MDFAAITLVNKFEGRDFQQELLQCNWFLSILEVQFEFESDYFSTGKNDADDDPMVQIGTATSLESLG